MARKHSPFVLFSTTCLVVLSNDRKPLIFSLPSSLTKRSVSTSAIASVTLFPFSSPAFKKRLGYNSSQSTGFSLAIVFSVCLFHGEEVSPVLPSSHLVYCAN